MSFLYSSRVADLFGGFPILKGRQSNKPIKANMFKGQGVISKFTTLSDRTIRIQIDCQEQNSEAEAKLFQLRGSLGYFAFNEAQVKDEDVPVDPIEFPG